MVPHPTTPVATPGSPRNKKGGRNNKVYLSRARIQDGARKLLTRGGGRDHDSNNRRLGKNEQVDVVAASDNHAVNVTAETFDADSSFLAASPARGFRPVSPLTNNVIGSGAGNISRERAEALVRANAFERMHMMEEEGDDDDDDDDDTLVRRIKQTLEEVSVSQILHDLNNKNISAEALYEEEYHLQQTPPKSPSGGKTPQGVKRGRSLLSRFAVSPLTIPEGAEEEDQGEQKKEEEMKEQEVEQTPPNTPPRIKRSPSFLAKLSASRARLSPIRSFSYRLKRSFSHNDRETAHKYSEQRKTPLADTPILAATLRYVPSHSDATWLQIVKQLKHHDSKVSRMSSDVRKEIRARHAYLSDTPRDFWSRQVWVSTPPPPPPPEELSSSNNDDEDGRDGALDLEEEEEETNKNDPGTQDDNRNKDMEETQEVESTAEDIPVPTEIIETERGKEKAHTYRRWSHRRRYSPSPEEDPTLVDDSPTESVPSANSVSTISFPSDDSRRAFDVVMEEDEEWDMLQFQLAKAQYDCLAYLLLKVGVDLRECGLLCDR